MNDEYYMRRVLRLARKGTGFVSPNPRVGAIVVKKDQIISKGYHTHFGGPHAEINALSNLRNSNGRGSTLFVNLEPCVHHGKTPPCVDAILDAGVRRVVIGVSDPNPLVDGKGIEKLKKSGVEVKTGVLEFECERLNESFIKFITQKKPFITLKIAQTIDGKIATSTGHSKWVTGETSRQLVHRMRRENDAVLVGIDTVLIDDPELNIRLTKGIEPKRIILDSGLRIPFNAKIINHAVHPEKTIIATTPQASLSKVRKLEKRGITVWILKQDNSGKVSLEALLKKSIKEGIASILVEGGKEIFTTFIRSKNVDRLFIFIAPKLLGEGIGAIGQMDILTMDEALILKNVSLRRCGSDFVFEGRL